MLNKAYKTAAELASENGKAEVARILAEYKAGVNSLFNIPFTTLGTAENGPDEGEKGKEKISLHAASEEEKFDMVKSLLEHGADINSRDAEYLTPLDRAALKGKVNVVRLLIELGADVNSRDEDGNTSLHFASLRGSAEVVLTRAGTC